VLDQAPFPSGELSIAPAVRNFDDFPTGGCTPPVLEEQFTLANSGNDCLEITAINNSAHFQFQPGSLALPADLEPGDSVNVTVRFIGGAALGTFDENLTVTRNPPIGDSTLHCTGEVVQAAPDIDFPGSHNFGILPVSAAPANWDFQITNNGTAPAFVSVTPSTVADLPFSWSAPPGGTLDCGESITVDVQFDPSSENTFNRDITIGINPGPNGVVHLSGEGCIPSAGISVDGVVFPDFGNVEKGYRIVRIIRVYNTGDGPLDFTATISGADAALFGLMPASGSIIDTLPQRDYSVLPVSPCGGSAGSGVEVVAVVFWANANAPYNATAAINIHFDGPPVFDWDSPLTASIVPPVPTDAVVVLDRSGSMNDLVAGGTKADAAAAAAQLMPQLLPPDLGHRFGAVRFNETADAFLAIAPLTGGNQQPRTDAITPAAIAPGGNTSIVAGTAEGLAQLASGPQGQRQALFVLSDGMDNTAWENPDDNNFYTILGGLAKMPFTGFLIPTDVFPLPAGTPKIYGMALGTGADVDKESLERLAGDTGGVYYAVDSADPELRYKLMKFYTSAYMDVVDLAALTDPKLTIQPGETFKLPFDVYNGDVGGLVVIYDLEGIRLPFWLESPAGEIVDASFLPVGFQVRSGYTKTARYLDFRVPQGEPERYAGGWKLVVQHQKKACTGKPVSGQDAGMGFSPRRCKDKYEQPIDFGFAIGIGSNFRMQAYVSPGEVYVGEPIWLDAVVTEAGLRVKGCTVTVTPTSPTGVVYAPITLKDNGQMNDGDPSDGEYANYFHHTMQPGSYHFLFHSKGMTRDNEPVVREVERSKYVKPKGHQPGVPTHPERPRRPGGGGKDDDPCKLLLREVRKLVKLIEAKEQAKEKKPPAKRK
jgi:hypothetical protein